MDKPPKSRPNGAYIALGLCFGTALGAAFHNVALGSAFGLLAGTVAMAIAHGKRQK